MMISKGFVLKLASLLIGFACLAFLLFRVRETSALQDRARIERERVFHQKFREGVGAEVNFPTRGTGREGIERSVTSLDSFIYRRSGLRLTNRTASRLNELEMRSSAETALRVSPDKLASTIMRVVAARLSALSDDELLRAAELLRGFDEPNLPDGPKRGRQLGLMLRRTGPNVRMSNQEFVGFIRDCCSSDGMRRTPASDAVSREVSKLVLLKVEQLSASLPETFGDVGSYGLTPFQSVLVYYSIVSDDTLILSESGLNAEMQGLQRVYSSMNAQPYPDPASHRPFGVNGYIYSTPLDVLFDESSLLRILKPFEGGNPQ